MTNEELKLHVQNLSKTIENWTKDYPEMKYNDLMTIISSYCLDVARRKK